MENNLQEETKESTNLSTEEVWPEVISGPRGPHISFDNNGNAVLKNRAYRRRKIKMEISTKNKPKKVERKKRPSKRKAK